MANSDELKRIKKKYGENFMKLCRELFPTILEHGGKLEEVLDSTFAGNSRTLYEDIVNAKLERAFKNYIYSKMDMELPTEETVISKTPYELLDEAGYFLYECLTEEEIQRFRKYYSYGEELCTFRGDRLKRCIVFFAVRKNAQDIKRENFRKPKREDEYGTSVMGIQFNRYGLCTVSIKNRYNHTVNNPDATYGNDLDRIVPGLTQSFANLLDKEYGLKLNDFNKEEFEIPDYVVANDGKYYKYNMEIDAKYYCPGNIIISDGEVKRLESPESQILMDYFIFDMKDKFIKTYDENIRDSFVDDLHDLEDAQITIEKGKRKSKIIKIQKSEKRPIIIELNNDNQIIGYDNHELNQVRNRFLCENRALSSLNLPNLVRVGDRFLCENKGLSDLNLINLKLIGEDFLANNQILTNLNLPQLKSVRSNFLERNQLLTSLTLLNLEYVGSDFLINNKILVNLNLPKLRETGMDFLGNNQMLTDLNLPNLERAGGYFLFENQKLISVNLPQLRVVGESFLQNAKLLTSLNLLNLEQVGDRFLVKNEELNTLDLPKLRKAGMFFLNNNKELVNLNLPSLEQTEDYFLYENEKLTNLKLPQLVQTGDAFLYFNKELTNLDLPKLEQVGDCFLYFNKKLTNLNLPNLLRSGRGFLYCNKNLINSNFPKLRLHEKKELSSSLSDRLKLFLEKNMKNEETSVTGKSDVTEEKMKTIDSNDIVKLDKENRLTKNDVCNIQKILVHAKEEVLDKDNRE